MRRREFLGYCAGATLLSGCTRVLGESPRSPGEASPPSDAPVGAWREYRNDAGKAGYTDSEFSDPSLSRIWTFESPNGTPDRHPVVADGRAYVCDELGHVHALDARTGDHRRTGEPAGPGSQRRTVAAVDDRIVAPTGGGAFALDVEDGSVEWRTELAGEPSSPTIGGGAAYLTSTLRGKLARIDVATGERDWVIDHPATTNPPAVAERVYTASDAIRTFDPGDGTELSSVALPSGATSPPVLVDGAALVGTAEGDLCHYRPGDDSVDRIEVGDSPVQAPTSVGDATVVAVDRDATAHLVDLDAGETRWRYDTGDGVGNVIDVSPTAAGDTVFVRGGDRNLHVLDASEDREAQPVSVWNVEYVTCAPAPVDDVLFVSGNPVRAYRVD